MLVAKNTTAQDTLRKGGTVVIKNMHQVEEKKDNQDDYLH